LEGAYSRGGAYSEEGPERYNPGERPNTKKFGRANVTSLLNVSAQGGGERGCTKLKKEDEGVCEGLRQEKETVMGEGIII